MFFRFLANFVNYYAMQAELIIAISKFFSQNFNIFRTDEYFLMKFGKPMSKYLLYKPYKDLDKILNFGRNIEIS